MRSREAKLVTAVAALLFAGVVPVAWVAAAGETVAAPRGTPTGCARLAWPARTLLTGAARDAVETSVSALQQGAPAGTLLRVRARLLGARREPDGTVRLSLADPHDPEASMTARLGPACSFGPTGSPELAAGPAPVALERACGRIGDAFAPLAGGIVLIGFASRSDDHDAIGRAPSGVELYPLLRLHAEHCVHRADPVLLAAGDVASCALGGDEATAAALDRLPGTVAVLGDATQGDGQPVDFEVCYEQSWGRHLTRTRPAAGNHEYLWRGASPYFHYFGARAGDPTRGYYAYDLGAWRVIVLNSNCAPVGGCERTSPQDHWLQAELYVHRRRCTLAYWHEPLFTSDPSVASTAVRDFWRALYRYGADVVLNGHSHMYERFAALDPQGRLDELGGIREFVVGTGGGGRLDAPPDPPHPASRARHTGTYGVLRFVLHADSYSWSFVPVLSPDAGDPAFIADAGSARCH